MFDLSPSAWTLALQGTPLDQAVNATSARGQGGGTAVDNSAANPPAGAATQRGMDPFIFIVLAMVAVLFMMTIFTGRRQRKQREAMLSALRKHDRVVTSGGIIGSVVEIKPRTVVLKVDESSNTRITFSRDAIQSVLEEAPESSEEAKT
ncbi:MAG: preprotein translocase subunit YajC [Phycisphaeraceae bacterium]|nr:preprotein translocase subunit YajC [Phycisphaeraceae bacterium]